MRGPMIALAVFLASLMYLHAPVRAQDGKRTQPDGTDSAASAQEAARDALARFEKWVKAGPAGTPAWKVRMECLVALAKAGLQAAPVLVDAVRTGSSDRRALAGEALGFLADARARPALEQATGDKERDVRLYAIRALGRLGRLEAKPQYRHIADKDPSAGVRFEMAFALTRDNKPELGTIRKALRDYDLARMDSARLGKAAPDFTLADTSGKVWRLSDFRGKNSVVLVFLLSTT
jgi:hypothetical protein